jgi:hypothetical protein
MDRFKSFITESKIKSFGLSADRHTKQYITPYLPGNPKHAEGTHEISAKSPGSGLDAGDKVTIHGHHTTENERGVRKHFAVVSKLGSKDKVTIPTSSLNKPVKKVNRGFEQETQLVSHLSKHGLMTGSGAGFTAGNDFHLLDKRNPAKHTKIHGSEGTSLNDIQGEHKSDIRTTAFGQLTLTRHPETNRWHISDKARAKRPEYAKHIENATVTHSDGSKKSLLDHLNDTESEPGVGNKSGFNSDKTTTSPAHAYMRDHHVDVVHIDSHGTYRAGLSAESDRQKLGLPALQGEGRFRVRQKSDNPNTRNVQFSITKLDKSPVHIGTDDGATHIKKVLGHN